MNLKQINIALLAMLVASPIAAQKKMGDFIESKSWNEARRGAERSMNYRPKDGRLSVKTAQTVTQGHFTADIPTIVWRQATDLFSWRSRKASTATSVLK